MGIGILDTSLGITWDLSEHKGAKHYHTSQVPDSHCGAHGSSHAPKPGCQPPKNKKKSKLPVIFKHGVGCSGFAAGQGCPYV